MPIKLALPKGRLMEATADRLKAAGWGLDGYHAGARAYRLTSSVFPDLQGKIFHEKDIPIQVAVGNYDLGICGRDWIEELTTKYPSSAIMKIKELGYGQRRLQVAASRSSDVASVLSSPDTVRIASEYPNLAEAFAVRLRLKRFSVFPLWGGAEVYPPESADLALIAEDEPDGMADSGLLPVSHVLDSGAFLIANTQSLASKDMRAIISSIEDGELLSTDSPPEIATIQPTETSGKRRHPEQDDDIIWLALPDGHQQKPTLEVLTRAGISINDYPSATGNRRPVSDLPGVNIKVIRPQDMPLQVANGNFDLAVTGRDWLREHLNQFPSSPVRELLDLKYGGVRIVAVVTNETAVTEAKELRQLNGERQTPFRVASEYVNIADRFARENHLGWYRIVPTWGASEGFLPEDADCLIENTQTGRTIAEHNLKIIDTLFSSTACVVGRPSSDYSTGKVSRLESIIARLRRAVEV